MNTETTLNLFPLHLTTELQDLKLPRDRNTNFAVWRWSHAGSLEINSQKITEFYHFRDRKKFSVKRET